MQEILKYFIKESQANFEKGVPGEIRTPTSGFGGQRSIHCATGT